MTSPVGHGHSAPDACSVLWDRDDACAYGTAPPAGFWVALEQSGPWGRDAARQSHLDEVVGDRLARICADGGGRFILVRRPGGHADRHTPQAHRVYVAWAGGHPWMLTGTVADPADLADLLDPAALAEGDEAAVNARWLGLTPADPVLLICTNAKRDVCCAVRGRPVALAAAAERPGRVWECSHTGGHRYAPTGILLPHGRAMARLDADHAIAAVDAAAEGGLPPDAIGPAHDRGRSALEPAAQAAESFIRNEIGELGLTALKAAVDPDGEHHWHAVVSHADGRTWPLEVHRQIGPDELPASCGKGAAPVTTWHTTLLGPTS